jgi:hypothetical protein
MMVMPCTTFQKIPKKNFFSVKFIVLQGQSLHYTYTAKGDTIKEKLTGVKIKANSKSYEIHVSFPAPPLNGGSLGNRTIPAMSSTLPNKTLVKVASSVDVETCE